VHEIGRKLRQAIELAVRPAKFDSQIPTFDKAAFGKALPKCG
jgi:hypothetical protein